MVSRAESERDVTEMFQAAGLTREYAEMYAAETQRRLRRDPHLVSTVIELPGIRVQNDIATLSTIADIKRGLTEGYITDYLYNVLDVRYETAMEFARSAVHHFSNHTTAATFRIAIPSMQTAMTGSTR